MNDASALHALIVAAADDHAVVNDHAAHRHLGSAQRGMADDKISSGFATIAWMLRDDFDSRAHPPQDLQQTRTARIDADTTKTQL